MEIELKDVCYKTKLDNFSYKFDSGSVTSIIGKSGSGKSFVGYAIMDLIDKDSGSIYVDGKSDYDVYKLMKDVGYVFQNPRDHFFCNTVYEEIAFGLKQFRFKLNKIDIQVRNAIKMLGMDNSILNRRISFLSSGEAERVAIASSLVLNPKVLILDEPTIYLDNRAKEELVKLIRILKSKYNKTIIIMSNDMDFVNSVSDNYVLMDNGSIVSQGSIDTLTNNIELLEKYGMEMSKIDKFIMMVNKKYDKKLGSARNVDDIVRRLVDE